MKARQGVLPFIERRKKLESVSVVIRAFWNAGNGRGYADIYTPAGTKQLEWPLPVCANCNEAYYRTAKVAMEAILASLKRRGLDAKQYQLILRSKNKLVVGQLSGYWHVKACSPLLQYVREVHKLSQEFGLFFSAAIEQKIA